MALLEMKNVHVYYGRFPALKGISLTVEEGEIVALLGANGAGKTTTLRTISNLIPLRSGEVWFQGEPLAGMSAHDVVRAGITHVPEGRKIFSTLSVDENLNLGAYTRRNDRDGIEESREQVFELFPRLRERRKQLGGTLSGGEQQMLAIGRALMARPKLLLLDEPSLGLAPLLVRAIFKTIKEINERGVTILIVEQNARAALRLSNRAYVLETGRIVISGVSASLLRDEGVRGAYLG